MYSSVSSNNSKKRKNIPESIECDNKGFDYVHEIDIKIGNIQWAKMIASSLMPDKELNENKSRKLITYDEDVIHVVFRAVDWKTLRVNISSFYTNVELCLKTIEKL